MRSRIADPRSDMSQDERDAPEAADGRAARPRVHVMRAGCVRHEVPAASLLRMDGHANIAAANRHHARDPQRTLTLLQTAQTTLPRPCAQRPP